MKIENVSKEEVLDIRVATIINSKRRHPFVKNQVVVGFVCSYSNTHYTYRADI